jgi:hypothetical protein
MLVNHNSTTFNVVRDPSGKIDLEVSKQLAIQAVLDLAKKDEDYTEGLGAAAISAWEDPYYAGIKFIALSALVRMSLNRLNILPDDKNCKDALIRIRSVITYNPDKFLMLKAGNNSNVYYIPRYSSEELTKLLATKTK